MREMADTSLNRLNDVTTIKAQSHDRGAVTLICLSNIKITSTESDLCKKLLFWKCVDYSSTQHSSTRRAELVGAPAAMHSVNRYSKYTFWLVLLQLHLCGAGGGDGARRGAGDSLHREKRQLLWPNTTLLQFNAGIGTPTPVKTIQANWAFQANFQLPWNRTQIPGDIFFTNTGYEGDSKKKRDIEEPRELDSRYESDAKLFHLYKYVEDILHSFGHNGTTCVLQTLCQLGREPLHSDDEENLLYDLASFALNPNHDEEEENYDVGESAPYIEAFDRGARNEECSYDCGISLIDMFTKVYLNR